MTMETLHDAPVDDPTLWQRPEHLSSRLGVTVRTLRKWVSRGRAERTRNFRGQVYYRLLEPIGPVGSGLVPERAVVVRSTGDGGVEALAVQIATAQSTAAELRARVEAVTADTQRVREENALLRRELEYQRELTAMPWWARRRRRDLTLPMVPLEGESGS